MSEAAPQGGRVVRPTEPLVVVGSPLVLDDETSHGVACGVAKDQNGIGEELFGDGIGQIRVVDGDTVVFGHRDLGEAGEQLDPELRAVTDQFKGRFVFR